jgi:hypothetical protein
MANVSPSKKTCNKNSDDAAIIFCVTPRNSKKPADAQHLNQSLMTKLA